MKYPKDTNLAVMNSPAWGEGQNYIAALIADIWQTPGPMLISGDISNLIKLAFPWEFWNN